MASLQRAQQLRNLHRNDDALAEIKLVLAQDPDNAEAFAELTITLLDMDGRKKEALEAINSAIALEADDPEYLAMKSVVLSALDREKEALIVADDALRFSPGPFQWYAKAVAHAGLRQWSAAETACNRALEIDSDYDSVLNLKNNVLRMQGRLEEASRNTEVQLSRNAENPHALANAGWTHLQRGDFKKSEELFREALRSDAENEFARSGLVEAYKARSLFYRLFLKWVFFLQKMEGKSQWILIIGIYLIYRLGRSALEKIHPGLGVAVMVLYLLFVLGAFIAPGIGHFLLLKDKLARLSLDAREKWDGIIVGGLFFGGILITAIGALISIEGLVFVGGSWVVATVPAALVFRNYSRNGQFLFGGIALFAIITGLTCLYHSLTFGDPFAGRAGSMIGISLLGVVLSTWFANSDSLMKHS